MWQPVHPNPPLCSLTSPTTHPYVPQPIPGASPCLAAPLALPWSCPVGTTLAEQLQVPDLLAHLELQDLLQHLLALRLQRDPHALQLLPVQPQQRPACKRGIAQCPTSPLQWEDDPGKGSTKGSPSAWRNEEGARSHCLE